MGKEYWKSACPHDCPSACSLEVERLSSTRIGRIRGAAANTYTDGVVCAKVARYAERVHHPDRLKQPLQRVGEKGKGEFRPIPWEAALDEIAEAFGRAVRTHGSEAVWPYHSGGTMGVVQRWGIDRLRHAFGYSRHKTPQWASAITGLPIADIVAFARLYGGTKRSFLRLGFGFTRSRNGSTAMHAVSCLPAMTGAWQHRGGGAFFLNWDNWRLDTTLA